MQPSEASHTVLSRRHHLVQAALVDGVQGDVQVGLGLADPVARARRQVQGLARMCRGHVRQGEVGLDPRQQVEQARPIGILASCVACCGRSVADGEDGAHNARAVINQIV